VTPNRREFLWTAGAAAAAAGCQLKDYRWSSEQEQQVGWAPLIEQRRSSVCLVCPARCGIRGRTVDGRLVRITGNALHPMSQGGLCPRGVGGVQLLYHPQRIAAPVVRVGERGAGQWRAISSQDAVATLAQRLGALRTAGRPERLAVVAGYCAGTMHELWRRFLEVFGSPNYVTDEYPDGADAVMDLMHGIPRRPGYDLDRARLVLSFGAPLFESWWSPLQAFVAFGGSATSPPPGGHFVQVDMRFSRTAARAHEWVGVPPGTHGVLALGIAYVLIKEQAYDANFVARHVAGFEDGVDAAGRVREGYRSIVLRNYRTEEVSAITGVPVERIVGLARAFAAGPGAVAVCGDDVLHAPDGLLAGLAVHSLNVLVGNISRPGGVLFGDDPPLAPLAAPHLDAVARAGLARPAVAHAAVPFGTGDPARQFAAALAQGGGEVEALLLYYSNPLASAAHPEDWRAALERIPFVVSFSPFLDETARFADLVLPDALPYERWQDAPTPSSYPYQVWGLAQPLVPPPDRTLPTAEVLLSLARALGGSVGRSLPYADMPTLLQARARGLFAARRGMILGDRFERTHYRQMEERGWWLAEQSDFDEFWKGIVEAGGWTDLLYDGTDPARLARTASGRIELLPETLQRALGTEGRGRTAYAALRSDEPAATATAAFPLRLVPYRVSTLSSGTIHLEPWLAEQPSLTLDEHWRPWVEVSAATAGALGLRDGAMVTVVSARGRCRARLRVFPGTAPGQVSMPYGLRHPDGELANPLQLLEGATDPLTGLTAWFSTFVRLERA
jgi:anaerobic selenocysteine-containing dehydrogenase